MDELALELINIIKDVSSFLWSIALKQARVSIISSSIWLFVGLTLLVLYIVGIRFGWRNYKEASCDFEDWFGGVSYVLWCMFIGLATFLIIAFSSNELIQCLVNPEYKALTFLMDLIK